jgi:hypothetical protein
MTETPEWKKALREPNAIGWIGFFLLVVAIGVGTIFFGGGSGGSGPAKAPFNHAAR